MSWKHKFHSVVEMSESSCFQGEIPTLSGSAWGISLPCSVASGPRFPGRADFRRTLRAALFPELQALPLPSAGALFLSPIRERMRPSSSPPFHVGGVQPLETSAFLLGTTFSWFPAAGHLPSFSTCLYSDSRLWLIRFFRFFSKAVCLNPAGDLFW